MFLEKLYKCHIRIISKQADAIFVEQSKAMAQPCVKIFPESDIHNVILDGSRRMRADRFNIPKFEEWRVPV